MSIAPNLAAALDYAARGWLVTPLHHPVAQHYTNKIICSCQAGGDCPSVGKHPKLQSWRLSATTDPETLQKWWQCHKLANVGIATGGPAGLVILDIDGDAGRASLATLTAEYGPLPETLQQTTGRVGGGMHYVFCVEVRYLDWIRNKTQIAPGIDIRSEGGLIVAAPSLHASGARYAWVDPDAPVAPLPEWIGTLTRSAKTRQALWMPGTPPITRPDESTLPSVEECMVRAIAYISHRPAAISGQNGHAALFTVALDVVRGFAVDPDDAVDLIDEHYSLRCDPQWSRNEIAHKVWDAYTSTQVGWAYHCGFVGDVTDGSAPGSADAGDSAAVGTTTGAVGADAGGAPSSWRASSGSTDSAVYCGARVVDVTTGAKVVKVGFEILDGPHRGRRLRMPLDWPVTDLSCARWAALERVAGAGAIANPTTVMGRQLRIEVVPRDRGLRVARFFAAHRSPAVEQPAPEPSDVGDAASSAVDDIAGGDPLADAKFSDDARQGELDEDRDDDRSPEWNRDLDPSHSEEEHL